MSFIDYFISRVFSIQKINVHISRELICVSGPESNIDEFQDGDNGGDGTWKLSETPRVIDKVTVKYKQVYLLTTKIVRKDQNGRTKVYIKVLFAALMRDKKKESYTALLQLLCEIYAHRHPTGGSLQPRSFRLDFESGSFRAIKNMWPNLPIQRCAFHLVSAARQNLCKIFKTSKPSDNVVTKK